MRRPAGGQQDRNPAKQGFRRLSTWPRWRPLRIEVVHRGGGESWWLIKARGTQQVFPGHLALEDVMARVLSER